MTKILQCQRGTDEINHANQRFTVNNVTWRVKVPRHIADFMILDGRAGVYLIDDPAEDEVICPHCHAHLKVKET